MILTPKPVRQAIASATGRTAGGVMVRLWAAAIFYSVIGAAVGVGACVAVSEAEAKDWGAAPAIIGCHNTPLAEADAGFVATKGYACEIEVAHNKMLSPKDGCHKQKGKGVHWHKGDNPKNPIGGPCIKVDGKRVKLAKHALCGEARAAIFLDRKYDKWVSREHAQMLVDCVVGLKPPAPRSRQ